MDFEDIRDDEAGTSKAQGKDDENDSDYNHTESGGVDGEHKDTNDDERDKDELTRRRQMKRTRMKRKCPIRFSSSKLFFFDLPLRALVKHCHR
jgi:hypothetical protein